jgi:hypothetical protein
VDIFGGWWMVDGTPSYDFSLPCNNFGRGYIFSLSFSCLGGMWHTFIGYASFSFLSIFLTCFVGMWHTFFGYASFYFFLYSPYIMVITLERDSRGIHGVLFLDGWMDVLAIFQV